MADGRWQTEQTAVTRPAGDIIPYNEDQDNQTSMTTVTTEIISGCGSGVVNFPASFQASRQRRTL